VPSVASALTDFSDSRLQLWISLDSKPTVNHYFLTTHSRCPSVHGWTGQWKEKQQKCLFGSSPRRFKSVVQYLA